MDEGYNEVRFDLYCKTCKHKDVKDIEEPCNECLDIPAVMYSVKPVKYKEKE